MLILGIETSGRRGSTALCRDAEVLAVHRFAKGPRHARDIVPAIDRIMEKTETSREQIGGVAVSHGPGSFTGLRVGITCAKTMAYILGWKSVGIPSLEVLVQNVDAEELGITWACPLRDARRSAVYGTLFRWDGSRWDDETGVMLDLPENMTNRLPDGTLVFGSGVEAYPEVFESSPGKHLQRGGPDLGEGRGECVAQLGARYLQEGQETQPMELKPHYYRRTAAEDNL
jgi:tRNA threonylcarbamoyladenosine biosynthesis protein TsaB